MTFGLLVSFNALFMTYFQARRARNILVVIKTNLTEIYRVC